MRAGDDAAGTAGGDRPHRFRHGFRWSSPLFSGCQYPGWTLPEQDKNNEITLQIGAAETETLDVDRFYIGSKELLIDKTDFTSVKKANASMGYLDAAVEATNDVRGAFGAAYSHLEHTHNNLSVTAENMTGRRARAGIPTWLRNLRITRRPTSPGRCQIPCCPRQTPFPT